MLVKNSQTAANCFVQVIHTNEQRAQAIVPYFDDIGLLELSQ